MSSPIYLSRPRLLSPDRMQQISDLGAKILADFGLCIRHPSACQAAAKAGFRVVGERVFPDHLAIIEFLENARSTPFPPSSDTHPPPDFHLTLCQYATHVHDLNTNTIVPFTTPSLIEAAKLADAFAPQRVFSAAPGSPSDVPDLLQPLLQYKIQAQYCRHGRVPVDHKWPSTLPYLMAMAEALDHPLHSLPVYVASPLTIGAESLASVLSVTDKLSRISTSNMPSVGGSAPLNIFDALALGVAEVAGSAIVINAITSLPVDWSITAMSFDLRGLAMSFGSPEHQLFLWAAHEMNAFLHGQNPGLPSGYGSLRTQAKLPGPQAAAEKAAGGICSALWGARRLNGAGSLSLDEIFSAEQFIIDCEIRDHIQRFITGLPNESTPGSLYKDLPEALTHGFLDLSSTLDHYRDVYWLPRLFERRSLQGWMGAGAPDFHNEAKELARKSIKQHNYELPSDLLNAINNIYADAQKNLVG